LAVVYRNADRVASRRRTPRSPTDWTA